MVTRCRRWGLLSISLLAGASCGKRQPDDGAGAPTVSPAGRAGDLKSEAAGRAVQPQIDVSGGLSESSEARKLLTALRARPGASLLLPAGLAAGFRDETNGLRPLFARAAKKGDADVTFARHADSALRIVD